MSWIDNLRKWFNTFMISLFRATINKGQITQVICLCLLKNKALKEEESIGW